MNGDDEVNNLVNKVDIKTIKYFVYHAYLVSLRSQYLGKGAVPNILPQICVLKEIKEVYIKNSHSIGSKVRFS